MSIHIVIVFFFHSFTLPLLKYAKRTFRVCDVDEGEFNLLLKYIQDVYGEQYSKTTALSGRTSQFKLILQSIKQVIFSSSNHVEEKLINVEDQVSCLNTTFSSFFSKFDSCISTCRSRGCKSTSIIC